MNLQGRHVAVLGAGRSGRSAAALALRSGARVTLVDRRADAEAPPGAALATGEEVEIASLGAEVVVVSPGIAAASPWVRSARAGGAEVIGELGFAWGLMRDRPPTIAITGTNGKSTTTWFAAQLLQATGRRAFAGGNLGTPLSEAVLAEGGWDALVIEVSSYQLELPGDFAPDAAAILNLTPDHLGRHGDMAGYAAAKCALFDRMAPGAPAAIPVDDPWLGPAAEGRGGLRRWLGAQPGVTLDGAIARLEGADVELSGLALPGWTNRWNAAVACWLAAAIGADPGAMDPSALRGLPHRMEPVGAAGGVTWINDSKATNVDATRAALAGLDGPAVVLLGGSPKAGSDYAALAGPLAERARAAICFGQTGPEIAAALSDLGPRLHRAPDLEAAVEMARALARPGDAALLSPACASFDAFRNFEHRGDRFRALVQEILAQENAAAEDRAEENAAAEERGAL